MDTDSASSASSASSTGSLEDFINLINFILETDSELDSEFDGSDLYSGSDSDSSSYSDTSRDEYYDIDDPLLVEIRRVLMERGEGIVLEGLSKHVHKLKVIYEVLVYYRIPAVIKTENGIEDPSKIDKRSPAVFDELMEDVGFYCKEAMVSLRDNIYEDYEAHISEDQLEQLMAKWVEEKKPTDDDREEVLHSFTLPIETDIPVRREKRRQRILKDVMETLEQRTKEEMTGLKSAILTDYRVKICDDDLSSVIKQWSGSLVLRDEVRAANGLKTGQGLLLELLCDTETYTKEKLLALKTDLPEHLFTDLFISWVDQANPSDSDVRDVWGSVDVRGLCYRLELHVVVRVSRGLTESAGNDYKYSSYYWLLDSAEVALLITQGYFTLCSTSDYNSATQCKIAQCSEGTHPCYTLTVQDGRYCVVDSEKCAEGGLADSSNKGEKGHSHTSSVLHYWLMLSGVYHSLITNSKEYIDVKIKDYMSRGRYISIYLMFDPKHED